MPTWLGTASTSRQTCRWFKYLPIASNKAHVVLTASSQLVSKAYPEEHDG